MALSQNAILAKCLSPKSLLLLHFYVNLSENFRIDVNMDFANKKFEAQNPKKTVFKFSVLSQSLLRDLRRAVLRAWTQNHPEVVGTCPGHHPQTIGRNRVFEIERPEPP